MNAPFSRRAFLKCSLAATALPHATRLQAAARAALPADDPGMDGLTTYQLGPQIWVRWNNRLLTCYRAHRSQKYPYLYPLAGPLSAVSLTSETSLPFPHHRSLFFGCDRVNDGNYWQEDYDQGQILSAGPKLGKATKDSVEILDACEWQKPGGPVVMKDQRTITVTVASDRLRFVDWEIHWQAVEDIKILKTNHSLFSARAAADITPLGGGNLVNAEGLSGEKGTFGKPSAWCDFYGRRESIRGDVVEGIAILDHPKKPWSPCPWFTRDYGFMSPTPFNFIEKPWELAAGKSVTLRYRVVLYGGSPKKAGLDAIFQEWAVRVTCPEGGAPRRPDLSNVRRSWNLNRRRRRWGLPELAPPKLDCLLSESVVYPEDLPVAIGVTASSAGLANVFHMIDWGTGRPRPVLK